MIVTASILVSSYAGFYLLRRRLDVLSKLALRSVHLLDGLLEPGDEDEKLEALEDRTSRVLVSLLGLLALAGAIGCITAVLPWAVGKGLGVPNALDAFGTWTGIVALSIGGTLSFVFPKWKAHEGAYSPLDQLLHRIALDHPTLHRWLHDREVRRWRKRGGEREPRFLLVTGLARAGTTSLLQRLEETGAFRSLNYANMPFVMAPGSWRRFYKPKAGELKERSHGDGILVGADSAEALEEPFFLAHTEGAFVAEDHLAPHGVDAELHDRYLDYQGLVRSPGTTYLAKNNNALLRYPSLREYNRAFTAVLMFREPLAHAASLLAMHRRYIAMQDGDPFVRTYMDWLAHHEFGGGHKPFRFDSKPATGDPDTLDYWLDRWTDYYRHALSVDGHRLLFVSHAMWSASPTAVLQAVLTEAGIEAEAPRIEPHTRQRDVNDTADPKRLEAARAVYNQLVERALHLD